MVQLYKYIEKPTCYMLPEWYCPYYFVKKTSETWNNVKGKQQGSLCTNGEEDVL